MRLLSSHLGQKYLEPWAKIQHLHMWVEKLKDPSTGPLPTGWGGLQGTQPSGSTEWERGESSYVQGEKEMWWNRSCLLAALCWQLCQRSLPGHSWTPDAPLPPWSSGWPKMERWAYTTERRAGGIQATSDTGTVSRKRYKCPQAPRNLDVAELWEQLQPPDASLNGSCPRFSKVEFCLQGCPV